MIEQTIYDKFQDINVEFSEKNVEQDVLIINNEFQQDEYKYYVYIKIPETKTNATYQLMLNFQNNQAFNATFYFYCNEKEIIFSNQKQNFILIQDCGIIQYLINIIYDINAEKNKEIFVINQTVNEISVAETVKNSLNLKENLIPVGLTTQYFRGDKTFQTLDKNVINLNNVDNTSDINKPISTAVQTALNLKINDAPSDNNTYGRRNGSWSQVLGGSGSVVSFNSRIGAVVSQSGDYSMPQISGTAGISQGGTGQTTAQGALNALLSGTVTNGRYLRGNGVNAVMSQIQVSDLPTLNQDTTGQAGSVANNLIPGLGISGSNFNGSSPTTWTLNQGYGDLINPYGSKTANTVLCAPNGNNNFPSFRILTASDTPENYSKNEIDTTILPNNNRYWFRSSNSVIGMTINSTTGIDFTGLFGNVATGGITINSNTIITDGVSCPLIYDAVNNVIKANPTTTYAYKFDIIIGMNARLNFSGSANFRFELRRSNGLTVIPEALSRISPSSGAGLPTGPFGFVAKIRARVQSGGADLHQTTGFKIFAISEDGSTDAMVFSVADNSRPNFVFIVES